MPRCYQLSVVPAGEGAQVMLRDGHGRFVLGNDLDELGVQFSGYAPSVSAAVEAVREFLEWEQQSFTDRPRPVPLAG